MKIISNYSSFSILEDWVHLWKKFDYTTRSSQWY